MVREKIASECEKIQAVLQQPGRELRVGQNKPENAENQVDVSKPHRHPPGKETPTLDSGRDPEDQRAEQEIDREDVHVEILALLAALP